MGMGTGLPDTDDGHYSGLHLTALGGVAFNQQKRVFNIIHPAAHSTVELYVNLFAASSSL